MKILIIGAAGMIGMRLAKSIVKGDFSGRINDITLFDVIPPKIERDKNSYKIKTGDMLVIESRRGKIAATTRADEHMLEGVVMMPFTFSEAAANLITTEALDPFGKIPEFKFCAVSLKEMNEKNQFILN